MKIILEMDLTNGIPNFLERTAKTLKFKQGKELELVVISREVDWETMPRKGESISAIRERDPLMIEWISWDVAGTPLIHLKSFDENELGDQDEALALLLENGWEVEIIDLDDCEIVETDS